MRESARERKGDQSLHYRPKNAGSLDNQYPLPAWEKVRSYHISPSTVNHSHRLNQQHFTHIQTGGSGHFRPYQTLSSSLNHPHSLYQNFTPYTLGPGLGYFLPYQPQSYPMSHQNSIPKNHPTRNQAIGPGYIPRPRVSYPNNIPLGRQVLNEKMVKEYRNRRGVNLHSAFVDNLRVEVEQVILRRAFAAFGAVKDVYVPRKLRQNRSDRYGFVRFATLHEAKEVARISKGKKCLGISMVVRLADQERYSRISKPAEIGRMQENGKSLVQEVSDGEGKPYVSQQVPHGAGSSKGGTSYCEVVRNRPVEKRCIDLVFEEAEENVVWLKASVVAYVREVDDNDGTPLFQRFLDEEVEVERIALLGGEMVLLTFKSQEYLSKVLE